MARGTSGRKPEEGGGKWEVRRKDDMGRDVVRWKGWVSLGGGGGVVTCKGWVRVGGRGMGGSGKRWRVVRLGVRAVRKMDPLCCGPTHLPFAGCFPFGVLSPAIRALSAAACRSFCFASAGFSFASLSCSAFCFSFAAAARCCETKSLVGDMAPTDSATRVGRGFGRQRSHGIGRACADGKAKEQRSE